MPKVSKTTATLRAVPGFLDAHEQYVGDWSVTIETHLTDMDLTPFFEGAPDDRCQAHHMGFMLKGRFTVGRADGVEETFEAGDAFVIEPGHTGFVHAGCEWVAFTPAEEARQQEAVMRPNVVRYAQEHGIELPAEMTSA